MSSQQIHTHKKSISKSASDDSKLAKFHLGFEINRTVSEERRVTRMRTEV